MFILVQAIATLLLNKKTIGFRVIQIPRTVRIICTVRFYEFLTTMVYHKKRRTRVCFSHLEVEYTFLR